LWIWGQPYALRAPLADAEEPFWKAVSDALLVLAGEMHPPQA
jgi:hypothetical protein